MYRIDGLVHALDELQMDYDDHVAMMDVKEDHPPPAGKFQAEIRLYLEPVGCGEGPFDKPAEEAPAPEEEGYPLLDANGLLLFLKFYEPATETLTSVGTHVAQMAHTLEDLLPVLKAAKGFPADQHLNVFEEVEYETTVRFEPLTPGKSLKECELQSGDILVFQTHPPQPPPATPANDVEMVPVDGAPPPSSSPPSSTRSASPCSAARRRRSSRRPPSPPSRCAATARQAPPIGSTSN